MSAAIAVIVLATSVAQVPSPCVQTHPLYVREVAPCSGVLWPPSWSAEGLVCRDVRLPKVEADRDKAVATLKQVRRDAAAYRERCVARIGRQEEIAAAAAGIAPPWFERPSIMLGMGLVAGAAGATLIIKASR